MKKKVKYFQKVKSIADLTREYRRLCKIHHPDTGGDAQIFNQVKEQRDAAARILMKGEGMSDTEIGIKLNSEEWMDAISNFGLEKIAEGDIMKSANSMAEKIAANLLAGDAANYEDENGNVSFKKVISNVFGSIFGNTGKDLEAGKDEEQKKLNP